MTVREPGDLLEASIIVEEGYAVGNEPKPVLMITVQGRAVTHTAEGKPRLRVYEPKATIVLTADQFKKFIGEAKSAGY
jgi:hypothetical protein